MAAPPAAPGDEGAHKVTSSQHFLFPGETCATAHKFTKTRSDADTQRTEIEAGSSHVDEADPRFTMGLVIEVAGLLVRHGYAPLHGREYVQLRQHLFRFLYRERPADPDHVVPEPSPEHAEDVPRSAPGTAPETRTGDSPGQQDQSGPEQSGIAGQANPGQPGTPDQDKDRGQRAPRPGERCTCGRPALVVYRTEHGDVPYCGIPDGGKGTGT